MSGFDRFLNPTLAGSLPLSTPLSVTQFFQRQILQRISPLLGCFRQLWIIDLAVILWTSAITVLRSSPAWAVWIPLVDGRVIVSANDILPTNDNTNAALPLRALTPTELDSLKKKALAADARAKELVQADKIKPIKFWISQSFKVGICRKVIDVWFIIHTLNKTPKEYWINSLRLLKHSHLDLISSQECPTPELELQYLLEF